MYKEHEQNTVIELSVKNFVWSVIAIVLGYIVDDMFKRLSNKFKIKKKLLLFFIQLSTCCVLLSIIRLHVSPYFGWSWQNITPGLFFETFFFGVQFYLFDNIKAISNIIK